MGRMTINHYRWNAYVGHNDRGEDPGNVALCKGLYPLLQTAPANHQGKEVSALNTEPL